MQRSKLVLGIVVALGIGGLGAAAVAMESDTGGAGSLAEGTTTTTTTVVDPPTTTTLAPTTTTLAPVSDPTEPIDEPASGDTEVDRSTEGCDGETYATHGDYVSSVAHDPDRQPGDVPAAAQSDCGKPLESVDTGDAGETDAPGQGGGQGKPQR
jgi:hypothetical protein